MALADEDQPLGENPPLPPYINEVLHQRAAAFGFASVFEQWRKFTKPCT